MFLCFPERSKLQLKKRIPAPSRAPILMLAALWLFVNRSGSAAPVERYTGEIILPIDFFTEQGIRIEKHKWKIEVASDGSQWTLSFLPSPDKKDGAIVKGNVATGDPFLLPAMIPLVGTHHMRSSSELLRTAQERQFSKTGLPQYAEQNRSWKSTLRVYTTSTGDGTVLFVFQARGAQGQLTRVDFKLRSEAPRHKP